VAARKDQPQAVVHDLVSDRAEWSDQLYRLYGLSPDADVAKWQRRVDPVWKRLFGGCHLSRPVSGGLEAAGFKVERLETMYLPKTPRIAAWNEWGVARP